MPTPEQAFLAKNYDENSRRTDKDPRGIFRNPAESSGAGIVGPLGSSSFTLPTVERALTEMEGGLNFSSSLLGTKRSAAAATAAGVRPLAASVGPGARPPGSPTIPGSPSPTAGQSQHEVLQNFFQSLLSSKDRAGASAAAAAARATGKTNGNGGGSGSGTEDGG